MTGTNLKTGAAQTPLPLTIAPSQEYTLTLAPTLMTAAQGSTAIFNTTLSTARLPLGLPMQQSQSATTLLGGQLA